MATRSSGSSRKSLKVLPKSRLVARSMALAFGRSSVTSRMAPRRLLRTTSGLGSDIGIAPPDDERVGGKSAAALGCYDERIDLQLHDRDRLAERKPLHRLDRVEGGREVRSEEHTSELQSLMRTSYAVFCLK